MGKYAYVAEDQSLLTPYLKQWFVEPFIEFFPRWLPANIITLTSHVFVWMAFAVALAEGTWKYPISGLLIFVYLVLDHIDGAQARRTKCGSQLGEFLDHYTDAVNAGLLFGTVWLLFPFTAPMIWVLGLLVMYVHFAVYLTAQIQTGVLHFGRVGSTEFNVLLIVLLLFGWWTPLFAFMTTPLLFGLSPPGLLFVLAAVAVPYIAWDLSVRVPGTLVTYLLSLVLFFFLAQALPLPTLFVAIVLYNLDFIGKLMRQRLLNEEASYPNFIGLVCLLLMVLTPYESVFFLLFCFAVLFTAVRSVVHIFHAFREHWRWVL